MVELDGNIKSSDIRYQQISQNKPTWVLLDIYYETGYTPNTPIDIVASLPTTQGNSAPPGVKARLKHIEDMRIAVADRIQEAESNYVEYYNRKRVEQTHIKVGSLVRLRLDKINFKAFKQRGL